MNLICITDNTNFWRVVKPIYPKKIITANRRILRNGEKIISDVEKVIDANNIFGTVLKAIKKYRAHCNILINIKER